MNDLTEYRLVAAQARPADVLAFAGRAMISKAIDFFTDSDITHVGVVQSGLSPQSDVLVAESTIESGVSGPQTRALGETLANYGNNAQAWLLRLSDQVRREIDWTKFNAYIKASESGSIKYDTPGLFGFLGRELPVVGSYICQSETAKRMFCSGYATAIFEACGVLRGINWTEVSPQQFVEMRLFTGDPIQLIGKPRTIARYNTI